LVPSSGLDILADMKALFSYLLTLPIPHHQLFLAGFSGGGYPLRLAAVLAAEEKRRADPRFTVQGWVSFFGMGGDFLLDHWFTPRDTVTRQPLWPDGEPHKAEAWSHILEEWYGTDTEYSDLPYTEGLDGHIPSRGRVWESLHGLACFNDALTSDRGLSERLAAHPYTERPATIPEPYRAIYPQLYFESGSDTLPLTLSPCLLIHGDRDDVVPYEESLRTSSALKASGASVELMTIRGGDHNLCVDGAESPDALKAYEYAVTWMLGLVHMGPLLIESCQQVGRGVCQ
jgi:dienelactone hydrolase